MKCMADVTVHCHNYSFGAERTNEWNKARTLTAASDYEMHELYDAFTYSNN